MIGTPEHCLLAGLICSWISYPAESATRIACQRPPVGLPTEHIMLCGIHVVWDFATIPTTALECKFLHLLSAGGGDGGPRLKRECSGFRATHRNKHIPPMTTIHNSHFMVNLIICCLHAFP